MKSKVKNKIEISVIRVRRLEDGKAVGKSFRVFKNETSGKYLEYSPTAKLDNKLLSFEVTEDYERLTQAERKVTPITINIGVYCYQAVKLKKGYVRKSSNCPRTKKRKEKLKTSNKIKNKTNVRIGILLNYFSSTNGGARGIHSSLIKSLKKTRTERFNKSKKPKNIRVKILRKKINKQFQSNLNKFYNHEQVKKSS